MSAIRLESGRSGRRWVYLAAAILVPTVAVLWLLPRVTGTHPADSSDAIGLAERVVIQFNLPMNRASVEANFQTRPPAAGVFDWDGNQMHFTPATLWPERTVVEARLAAGTQSALGLPLLRDVSWEFATSEARVLFAWPQGGLAQIFRASLSGSELVQLTDLDEGIKHFDASPLRATAYLVTGATERGNRVESLDLEAGTRQNRRSCLPDDICQQVAVSPDGALLAVAVGQGDPESEAWRGRVIVAPAAQEESDAIYVSPPGLGSPEWVQAGLLAVFDRLQGEHVLLELRGTGGAQEIARIADELGQNGSWSPDGLFWVGARVEFSDPVGPEQAEFFSHLVRVDVSSGSQVDLTGRRVGPVEDATPTYSPDGGLIAFGRKFLDPERWTLGRQVWRMRADGSQAVPVTDYPVYHHSGFVWSPRGDRLLVLRFDQADPTTPATLGWLEVETGAWTTLAEGAFLPHWSP